MKKENHNDTGVVYKKSTGQYLVHTNGRVLSCALSSRLHKDLKPPSKQPASRKKTAHKVQGARHTDPVAVGDVVRYKDAGDGSGLILEVLPRRNRLSRPAPVPRARVFEQVIVSNVDQVVPVFAAASPTPKWGLLDRYLVAAAAAEIPALICITKLDLGKQDIHLEQSLEIYRRAGYPVRMVSSLTGEGLDTLKDALQDCISVLIGKSGVGKTSLLNTLQPGLGLRVKAVSRGEIGKGKHTTSHQEMFPLDFGGALVDTPGIREFGLWDIEEDELAWCFPEMRPFLGRCKFGLDCRHDEEPGCAVRKAVMDGEIHPLRYKSYMRLRGVL